MLIHRNEYGAKAGILPIIQEIRSRWPRFTIDEANLKMAPSYNTVGYTSVPMRID